MLHNRIQTTAIIHLGLMDRLRVLFGAPVRVENHVTTTVCQDRDGNTMYPRVLTQHSVHEVVRPQKPAHLTGLTADQR